MDTFALDLLDKSLTLKDFTTNKQDGCLLNKKGRKIFYTAWTRWQGKSEDRKNLQSVASEIIRELNMYLIDFTKYSCSQQKIKKGLSRKLPSGYTDGYDQNMNQLGTKG